MKTVISIPNPIYNAAEITVKELGLDRSQFYVLAIKEFIEHNSKDRITEKLNNIFSKENNET